MPDFLSFFRKRKKPSRPPEEIMAAFRRKYTHFKTLLESNSDLLTMISDMEDKLAGHQVFGMSYIRSQSARIVFHAVRMVRGYEALSGRRYQELLTLLDHIHSRIKEELEHKSAHQTEAYVMPHSAITKEMIDFTGGKNANLGEIKSRLGLPVPKGFAITTTAFNAFMESNQLKDEIRKLKMEFRSDDPETLLFVSESIQKLFIEGSVPEDVEKAIFKAYEEYIDDRGASPHSTPVSLRSSATLEDGEISFAGQYMSLLNVPAPNIITDYKRVLASLFTPRAISYRLHMGIPFEDAEMSVCCLEMVRSKASGVMYSRHPFLEINDRIVINAVWGLGVYAVDGVISPDTYTLSKDSDPILLDSTIARKTMQMKRHPDGYVMEIPVPMEMRDQPSLTREEAVTLARYAIMLEDHFKSPQDIEWALDETDQLMLLQSRPLRVEKKEKEKTVSDPVPGYPVLMEGGSIASPGVGCGTAHIVTSEADLLSFPDNGILIAPNSSPRFVIVMQKAQAILTNAGSVTGHMASLAREYHVPALLNTKTATTAILPGQTITVDANAGRVYAGCVTELLEAKRPRSAFMKDSLVFESLKKISSLIIPLNLINPKSSHFTPANCKTVHDIMRFIHEASYGEIFQLSDIGTDEGKIAVKLQAPLPIDLYVIDLGGGIDAGVKKGKNAKREHITSIPFKALLDGMLNEDLRHHIPRPINVSGFFSVMSEQMLSPHHAGNERFGDKSYAIISDKYMNFSSRVGYHYSVLDAYCGDTAMKNYIHFQFKGGAADNVRRNRRARLIQQILEKMEFWVEVQSDRVTARLGKNGAEVIKEKLDTIGKLLIFTRQMDMLMQSEAAIHQLADRFLKGMYAFDPESLI